mmetsp:Transcript_19030/g.66023  ORF Transcript_19030/g.66023 Transcript_19030/m.66023 type:complete len:140 (-) Transcript_19030:51-470(-)
MSLSYQSTRDVELCIRVTPVRGHTIELLRLLQVQRDAAPVFIHMPKFNRRLHASELHGAFVNLHGLLIRLHEVEVAVAITSRQHVDRFGHVIFHVATKPSQLILVGFRPRHPTERALLVADLEIARSADPSAATNHKRM